ncbi:MAG TPA: hypothetical protein VGM50_22965 [Gemmatimonadaceae bacterium]|jgi:hypothetical protein
MARNQKDFTYDAKLLLKDAGLVAADAAATVASSAQVLDLGLARFDGRVIVDTTALEIDTGNELYNIKTQFSNSKTFASSVVGGPMIALGHSSVLIGESASSPAVGRYEIPFANEINGVTYQYMRMYTDVAGTLATGINYTAYAVQQL